MILSPRMIRDMSRILKLGGFRKNVGGEQMLEAQNLH